MCGIVGVSGGGMGGLVEATNCLAHRGPDDSGIFTDPDARVGLGHRRLSILDLSPAGHQPMVSADGATVIVHNGEIYNFLELRAELESKGVQFGSRTDTEVLLNLFRLEGEAMLSRLNGIFAFAIWNQRDRSLLLARDALGVKPLYYAMGPHGFAFASEIKALLHLAPIAPDLDPVALHRYLSFLWCPGEGTPLKGVRKLQPGEAMVVREGSIERRWSWYQLPVFRGPAPIPDAGVAVEGSITRLRRAIERQMVADVPVGAFLSGGLDSSAVVAFARAHDPGLQCFTIDIAGGQDPGFADDLPYARRVADHLKVPLHTVRISSKRMAGDLERMVEQLDEPLADPAPLNVLYISELAREHGIKVLLSGTGADDLFAGYRRHRAIRLERYLSRVPRGARGWMDRMTSRLDQREPTLRRLSKLFNGAGMDGDARLANYFVWARESELTSLYTSGFHDSVRDAAATTPLLEFLRPLGNEVAPLERMLGLEQRFFLGDHNLPYTDKMSMAVGVEVRVPFLDPDLVEFSARLPVSFKQRGRVGKWVLKRGMEPYLPRDVIYRPKSGFGAPLRRWMRFELRELAGDLLSEESLRRRSLFRPTAVQRLMADNDAGKVDAAYTLFSLLCIEIWCRRFIDAPVGANLTSSGLPSDSP